MYSLCGIKNTGYKRLCISNTVGAL